MQLSNPYLTNMLGSQDRNNLNAAYCVIVKTKGSTPRKVGAKMVVYEDGNITGSIGGGNLEKKVMKTLFIK